MLFGEPPPAGAGAAAAWSERPVMGHSGVRDRERFLTATGQPGYLPLPYMMHYSMRYANRILTYSVERFVMGEMTE